MPNEREKSREEKPYFPDFAFRELCLSLAVLALVALLLPAIFPAGLEDPADPADSLYVPRPAWYFLWLYELLKFFSGGPASTLGVLLPPAVLMALFFWPLLDKSPAGAPRQRPLALALMGIAVLGFIALTVMGFLH
ncbi:MAG: hypothetical protein MUF52_06430 [Syntrophobacteraceae bacterium]|jgi:ubiquinol-cytochrome c reductase cytochrome b subunit|nr:hypothetical protein [Syntrophobacteraceae bacterium]